MQRFGYEVHLLKNLPFENDMGSGAPRDFWDALKIVGSPVLASILIV